MSWISKFRINQNKATRNELFFSARYKPEGQSSTRAKTYPAKTLVKEIA